MNTAITIAPSTLRQLELTLNALARCARKAIRLADKSAPEQTTGAWEIAAHRLDLLRNMLQVTAQFIQPPPPETQPQADTAAELLEPQVRPTPARATASPAPEPSRHRGKIRRPTPSDAAPKPIPMPAIRPLQGKGWRVGT